MGIKWNVRRGRVGERFDWGKGREGINRQWAGNVKCGSDEDMEKQRSAERSAIEHGGDSAPVGGARLRPMQEVIRNSPRLKNTRRKRGGPFMADPPSSKENAMANRSKDRRKSQAPTSKSKAKVASEKDVNDEDSEESNMDNRHRDENEEDEEEEDPDEIEESGQEEVLGEGMYEVEAIRKKRIRKVHLFSHSSE